MHYKTQEEELLEQVAGLSKEGTRHRRWLGVNVRPRAPRGVAMGWEAGAVITLFDYLFPKNEFIKNPEYLWEPRDRTNLFIVTPCGYPYAQISDFWTADVLWVRKNSSPYCLPAGTGGMDKESSSYWDVPIGCQYWKLRLQAYRPQHDTLVVYEKVIRMRLGMGYGMPSPWEPDSD